MPQLLKLAKLAYYCIMFCGFTFYSLFPRIFPPMYDTDFSLNKLSEHIWNLSNWNVKNFQVMR